MFINVADCKHTIDNTGKIKVDILGFWEGEIEPDEYKKLWLPTGIKQVKLSHKDIFNFKSNHKLKVTGNKMYVQIKPTITSNKLTISNYLPAKFTTVDD